MFDDNFRYNTSSVSTTMWYGSSDVPVRVGQEAAFMIFRIGRFARFYLYGNIEMYHGSKEEFVFSVSCFFVFWVTNSWSYCNYNLIYREQG
ncbi:MAG: hypothetical protein KBT66_13800, partial [Amphritea sp.]|nr:hypothetical protein [Amphritea sp.]